MTVAEIYAKHQSPLSKTLKKSDAELFGDFTPSPNVWVIKNKKAFKHLPEKLTQQEYEKTIYKQLYKPIINKYNNKRIVIDGINFQSTGEGRYYQMLKRKLDAGLIKGLKRQIPFEFVINGFSIGRYVCDFGVMHHNGIIEIIDHKSKATAEIDLYQWKKNLMYACFGVKIKEVNINDKL